MKIEQGHPMLQSALGCWCFWSIIHPIHTIPYVYYYHLLWLSFHVPTTCAQHVQSVQDQVTWKWHQ